MKQADTPPRKKIKKEEGEEEEEEEEEEDWGDSDFLSFSSAPSPKGGSKRRECIVAGASDSAGPARPDGREAPWNVVSLKARPKTQHPLLELHNEIIRFTALMEPRKEEVKAREDLVDRLRDLVGRIFDAGRRPEIKVFGSQATGLFLPTSDIDLVLMLDRTKAGRANTSKAAGKSSREESKEKEDREMVEFDAAAPVNGDRDPLLVLADALRSEWGLELTYLEVVSRTRVPIVKFTHGPSGLSVDICLNQDTGPKAADLVLEFSKALPPFRPLTFVLKYFLAARGLNEPYSGGVGSFLLQMMIVSFLQHREREEYRAIGKPSECNLGALLLEFLELYGIDFNYCTTGISVRHDGKYFPKGHPSRRQNFLHPRDGRLLAVENPFEPTMDVGQSSFKIWLVQRAFEVAVRVLMSMVSKPFEVPSGGSILASILPPSEEMWKRKSMHSLRRPAKRRKKK